MRRLRAPIFAALILLVVLNGLLSVWSRRLPYARALSQISASPRSDLLLIGNSLLARHFNEALFTQVALRNGVSFAPLNSAIGATLPPEHELLFNYAMRVHPEIRTVLVGVFDFQLTDDDESSPTDLTGNRMVGLNKAIPISDVSSAYKFGFLQTLEVRILRATPMAANRANMWRIVELLRRKMGEMGMPRESTNSMGRTNDFAALESKSVTAFDAKVDQYLASSPHFDRSYEKIFGVSGARGMRRVIVVMPASPSHRGQFYIRSRWKLYLDSVTNYANQRGIQVIDASNWVLSEDGFVDNLHMSDKGVDIFSSRLGEVLAR